MSKLFGKMISKKVKAIIISCCAGLAVAAGAITTAVVVTNNNRIVPDSGIGDAVVDTPIYDVTIGAGDNKSVKWNQAVVSSITYSIPVNVTLTENWSAYLNEKGTYKIFGTQSLVGFDVRGALEVPTGANINLNLGGYTLDRGLVDETNDSANRAVIAGSVIINRGTLNISNGTVQHGYSSTNGGGIYSYGDLTLGNNLTVRANYADLNGGGVYCEKTLTINGPVTMTGNYANKMNNSFTGKGGAVYAKGGFVTINNLTATNNQAAAGGALAFEGEGTTFTIKNSTFDGNAAYADNQSYYADGGAIWVGGSAYVAGAVNLIENCEIGTTNGNTAVRSGGGIFYWSKNDLDIIYTNIRNNTANNMLYGTAGNGGGLIKGSTSTLNIIGHNGSGAEITYISGNSAMQGGGVSLEGGTTNITGRIYFQENKFGNRLADKKIAAYGGHILNFGVLNIGTPIERGQTHAANDYQPQILRNGFNDNVNYEVYGGGIANSISVYSGGKYTRLCELNLYGGMIDQCKARQGGGIYCVYGGTVVNGKSLSCTVNMYDFTITRCASVNYNDQGENFANRAMEGDAIVNGNWNIYGGKITNCGTSTVTGITNKRQHNSGQYTQDSDSIILFSGNNNDNVNIYNCEISGNDNFTLIFDGSGNKTRIVAEGNDPTKVQIKNNNQCIIFNANVYAYCCTVSGNTGGLLCNYQTNEVYGHCKLSNNQFGTLGGGCYFGVNFKEWFDAKGIAIATCLFDREFNLTDCVVSGFTTLNYLGFIGRTALIQLTNTTITNNTFKETVFTTNKYHSAGQNWYIYYYLRETKITNNVVSNDASGIMGHRAAVSGSATVRVYIRGGNNVVKDNVDKNGNAKNISFLHYANWAYVGVYVDQQLGSGNDIWVTKAWESVTSTNYSKYAYVDGKYTAPSDFIHFDGEAATQGFGAYLSGDRLCLKKSDPNPINAKIIIQPQETWGSASVSMRPDGKLAFSGVYLTNDFNSEQVEIVSYKYVPISETDVNSVLSLQSTSRTYTKFIDGFFENRVITKNADGSTQNRLCAFVPGQFTVTFKPKAGYKFSDQYNGAAKDTAEVVCRFFKAPAAQTPFGDRQLYGSYENINYTPGTTLANSGTYYKYDYQKNVKYYTDEARTQEVSKDSLALPGTYYLSITPNYQNYSVYCNWMGDGYTTKTGIIAYAWYPQYQWPWADSPENRPAQGDPWQPKLIINKTDFASSCRFVAPENTIVSYGGSVNPYDKIEVWEGTGVNARKLVRGTDYTISFSNNTNITEAGMVTATITPLKNYTGVATKEFKISVSGTPKITGEPSVSSVVKAYDGTDRFLGTISKGTLKVVNASNVEYEEEFLSISSIKARYSQSAVGSCSLIVTITFVGNIQTQYNLAEYTFTTLGGEAVKIIGKDISAFTIPYTTYGQDGFEHIYKPTFKYNNGVQDVTLQEGVDFDFVYKRNGAVTTDLKSSGVITVEAVGKGMYTGTASGTYSIGSEYYHNPSLSVVLPSGNYKWTAGATYQVIEADQQLTNLSYKRISFDAVINNWGTAIAGPVPSLTVYFNYTNLGTKLSDWQTNGFTHIEITEPGSYTIFYYFEASDSKGWKAYKNGSFTVNFEKENADIPVTNATHTFTYDGTNKTFVTSYNTSQMDIRKVVYTAPDGKVTEYTGGNASTAYRESGTYKIEFKAKTLYQFNIATATESNTVYTVSYTITPRTLSAISMTGSASRYNGQPQGPEFPASINHSTNSVVVSGQTVYLGWLYTGTDRAGNAYSSTTKPTDAGDYTLTLTGIYSNAALTQKALNYKLATNQIMSRDFEITQAEITVNSPAITNTGNIYIGWKLSDLTLDDSVKVTFATNKNVAGHWEWTEPDTRLMLPDGTSLDSNHSFTKAYAAKFVVDDDVKHNFVIGDNVNKTITLTVTSLYVHVVEHLADEYGNNIDGTAGLHEFDIFVDYDSTFNLETYLADAGRSAQHGMVAALFDKANAPVTAIENITVNKTGDDEIHVRFTKATDTVYYQLHFREHQDLTYATVEQVVSYLNTNNYVFNSYPATGKTAITADNVATVNDLLAGTTLDCYIEVFTGTTGAEVTCLAVADTDYSAGYDLGDSTTANISGEGTTVVTKQYSLKTYKLSFDANGGSIPAGAPQHDVKRNAHITNALFPENNGYTPTRSGYKLIGWSTDRTATEAMDVSAFLMPAQNTTLYAVWEANTYTVIFNYTDYTKVGDEKLTDIADEKFQDLSEEERSQYITQPYGTETVAPVIKSLSLSTKPKYVGLTFKNWIYYVQGVATAVNTLSTTTLSKADLNESNGAVYVYAEWEPAKYTLSFNSNGSILSTRVSVTNFTKYTAYTAPAATTRIGYTFAGWYTEANKGGNFVVFGDDYTIDDSNGATEATDVALLANTTLYAGWTADEYELDVTGVSENVNITIVVGDSETAWDGTSKVRTGDVLTITTTALPGYTVDQLYVNDRICASGIYTVLHSYADKKIAIRCDAIKLTYNITYRLNGGSWTDASYTAPSTFDISNAGSPMEDDVIDMPDGTKLSRTGYTFAGWFMTDENGEFVGTAKNYAHDFFASDISKIANVQLTAKWTPVAKDIYVYKNSDSIILDWNDKLTSASTGETVTLAVPVPNSYKLVGLATSAEGRVEYYAREADSEKGEDSSKMYVDYVVKAGENNLYCKWIGSGELYVSYQHNNNYVYSPTGNLTIKAVSSKQYTDTIKESIKYNFTWYKYNGVRFVQLSNQVSTSPECELKLSECDDSGLYRCELIVTIIAREGSDYNKIVEYANNTPENLGQVIAPGDFDPEVTINKATLSGVQLSNKTETYTSEDLKDKVLVQYLLNLGEINEDGTLLTLPDGSTAAITYSYANKEGETVNEIVNVGKYTVTAEFELDEDSNYEPIDSLSATLTVNPKKITNISYGIEGLAAGTLTAPYTGENITVVATSSDIFENDAENVTITLTNAINSAVGKYEASVNTLDGTAKDNYTLQLASSKLKCKYEITKAQREIDVDFEGINGDREIEFTYDGALHTVSLAALPDNLKDEVTVTYSVSYTPNVENYSPSDNKAENNNGGKAAGTYVITATFGEKTGNYIPKADITATLIINKRNALSVDVTKTDDNGDSFEDNQYVVKTDDTVHKPVIVSLNNSETITATYKYEIEQMHEGMTEASWAEIPNTGFSASGQYRLTASFDYKTDFLKNNYAPIDDIVINYVVVRADLANLAIEYTDSEKKLVGSYGGTLDTNQFKVYAVYGEGASEERVLIKHSALSYFDMSSGSEVKFNKFNSVNAAYPIKIKYSTMSIDCTVNVGCATYDFDVTFDDVSKVYSKDGNTPDFTVNAITDVNGNAVSGVNFYFSVYNDTTKTWGEYVPVGDLKLYDVGAYKVKLAYKHSDNNYVGTDYEDFEKQVTVTITAKPVTEVTWQYSTDTVTWVDLPDDGLTYAGTTYHFIAKYEGATADAVANVAETATDVKDGGYVIKAVSGDKNYALGTNNAGLTKTVVINPREVEAKWYINGQPVDADEKQLVYDGSDHFGEVSASYSDVNGTKVNLTVNKEKNVQGNDIDMVNARTYKLTVSAPDDKNYKLTKASETQDIVLYGQELAQNLAWFEYTTNGTNYTKVPDNGELPYVGKVYNFRVCYYKSEADKAEGLYTEAALSTTAKICGDYELTGINTGSFYISNKLTVHVKPAKLTVTLTNPEFDGTEKAPTFNLTGVLDGYAATDLLTITGDLQARNVKNDGSYVMHVELNDSDAAKNYVLGDADERSIDVEWNVTPKLAVVSWSNLTLEYTGSFIAPTASIVQAVNDTDKITLNVRGNDREISDSCHAVVESILNEDGSTNYNYTLDTKTYTTVYKIVQTKVTVANVAYKEYTFIDVNAYKDATFVGRELRNDKLVGEAYITVDGKSQTVAGSFKFVSTEAFTSAGYYTDVAYQFVPTDNRHYATFTGKLAMFVKTKSVTGIDVDATGANTTFVNGSKIFAGNLSEGLKLYNVYNDYYYDEQNSTHYGTREEVVDGAANAQYSINGTTVAASGTGYTFKKAGVTEVTVTYGIDVTTYEITVTNYAVDKITLNKNTKTTYYVTEKFDVSTITLNVKYMGETNISVVDSGINVKGKYATDAFTEAGNAVVTIEYGGVEIDVTVQVLARQDLNIVYTGKDIKYTGSVIALPTATLNGVELVNNTFIDIDKDGVNDLMAVYSIYNFTPADKGLSPFASTTQTMLDQGAYDVKVTINVVNIKYNDHDAIVSTFNVVDGEVEKVYQLKLIESSTHEITTYKDGLFLTKVAVKTTVESIIGNFETTEGKIVVKKNGKVQAGTATVGTGCTIELLDENDQPVESVAKLTVVVKGDLNGDGRISATDYMSSKKGVTGKGAFSDAQFLANDMNNDNRKSAVDYMNLKKVATGKLEIKL